MIEQITPLIITYNEERNIERSLQMLTWASKIVVIDSYSDDATLSILEKFPQVEIFQRKFDTFAGQCNFGLQKVCSEWVLSLDADYILSADLMQELHQIQDVSEINGYFVKFKYCVFGKPLRGTLLPNRQILYRVNQAHYEVDGHAHRVIVQGKSGHLKSFIYHDDRKPVSRWFLSENKYSIIECQKLLGKPGNQLSFADRIRRKQILAPFIILIYCLIWKGGILDGWQGWYYAFQRMLAELLLSINLMHDQHEKIQSK
jgi:glycosyltransferase involved in cell wall biosynthesis